MDLNKYQLVSGENLTTFKFTSVGNNGQIQKIIQFTAGNYLNLFNLGFGDINSKTGIIDDEIISNNGDSEKVLATVVESIYLFTIKNPKALIYATGSTKSRTRLYQIGITKYYDIVVNDFIIFGQLNGHWLPFEKNINYDAFLVKRIKK
jgi:hypothetical protein